MHGIKNKLYYIQELFVEALAQCTTEHALEEVRLRFLSRQGEIAALMALLKDLSAADKRAVGPLLNELKRGAEEAFNAKKQELLQARLQAEQAKRMSFDVTAYTPNRLTGHLHPYTNVIEQLENVFISMGFQIADGPELETEYYNFQALNIPESHPARDMQDTFWLTLPQRLMRTHVSALQIREMEKQRPPIALFATGRCFRNEATDASHDFIFMQAEGLVIDKNISMSNLFATLQTYFQAIFERKDLDIRIRPSYFPFVEPGVEVDVRCPFCTSGCSVCKRTRWIEMGGAGLVHPNVLHYGGIDSTQYSGFAFGMGLTRLVMLKYGINDIRLLSGGKIDFLQQF